MNPTKLENILLKIKIIKEDYNCAFDRHWFDCYFEYPKFELDLTDVYPVESLYLEAEKYIAKYCPLDRNENLC